MENNTQLATVQQNSILEFDETLFKETINRLETFKAIIKSSFKENYHYGIIPGTKKPTLLQPGAELICRGFKLTDTYHIDNKIEDWEKGFFHYQITCYLTIPGADIKLTEGLGSCNTKENRYTTRWVSKKDVPPGIDLSTLEQIEKEGQYGKYFMYKIENPNPCDLANTILKMAKKRALVDAAKSIAGLSDIYTQDMDDFLPEEEPRKNEDSKNIPPSPPKNGVNKKIIELAREASKYLKDPDFKNYVKNNYKTASSTELKDYIFNKAVDAELKALEIFLNRLKAKKEENAQTEDQRKHFHKLCNDLAYDRQIYLEFAREKAGKEKLSTTKELTRQEMDIVISALEEKLQAPPEDDYSMADEFEEYQKMTDEDRAINEANKEMALNGDVPF